MSNEAPFRDPILSSVSENSESEEESFGKPFLPSACDKQQPTSFGNMVVIYVYIYIYIYW